MLEEGTVVEYAFLVIRGWIGWRRSKGVELRGKLRE